MIHRDRRRLRPLALGLLWSALAGIPLEAHAHGGPAAATGVLAADAEGPWLLQLSEGLALHSDGEWRFVCPVRFGLEGVSLSASAADGRRAFVAGADDVYRIERDGTITAAGAPGLGGNFVLALSAAGPEGKPLFGVRLLESGGTELLRLGTDALETVWRDDVEWTSMVGFRGELWLGEAHDRTLQLARVGQDGALVARSAFELSTPVFSLELRVAGDRLFVAVQRDTDHVLFEVNGIELSTRWQSESEIYGPTGRTDSEGGSWILTGGELIAMETGERTTVAEPFARSCLFAGADPPGYVCLGTQLYALAADGLGSSIFDLSQLRAPVLDSNGTACAVQWERFRADLAAAGVAAPDAEPPPAPIDSQRVELEDAPGRNSAAGCSVSSGLQPSTPARQAWCCVAWFGWLALGRRRPGAAPGSTRLRIRRGCTIIARMSDPEEKSRLSELLGLASRGESGALGKVFDEAYPELCALARARLRGGGRTPDGALETTVLVHEAFMRFSRRGELQAEHRGHFFLYAGRVMRSVIVDTVRERMAQRRGGGAPHAALTTQMQGGGGSGSEQEILKVHEALDGLAEHDPRLVQVVQLRYFAGMTDAEIAEVLGVTDRTVRRDWEKARLLLLEALEA